MVQAGSAHGDACAGSSCEAQIKLAAPQVWESRQRAIMRGARSWRCLRSSRATLSGKRSPVAAQEYSRGCEWAGPAPRGVHFK